MAGYLDDLKNDSRRKKTITDESPDETFQPVHYRPVQCPRCKSKSCPVYSTPPRITKKIRYHKCNKCGLCFKSIED